MTFITLYRGIILLKYTNVSLHIQLSGSYISGTMAELIDEATDQVHGLVGSRTDREERSEVCEPCKGDNDIQPATGWCETCDEMLCKDCYKIHCRLTLTRNHQLRSLDEMRNRKKTKKIESKCKICWNIFARITQS